MPHRTLQRTAQCTTPLGFTGTLLTLGVLLSFSCGAPSADADRPTLMVYAAASLRDLSRDLAIEFERRETAKVVFNVAGSNTLAQQIQAAPGADLFLSADTLWVDQLEEAGRTVPGARRDILSNRLVVVARGEATWKLDQLAALDSLNFRHLVLADPDAVPAGRYARAALEQAGIWPKVKQRVVPTLDVRAALALVESDPEILAMVYKTDALTSSKTKVLFEVQPSESVWITYCATLIKGGVNPEGGGRFLAFLNSLEARRIITRHGFVPLDS